MIFETELKKIKYSVLKEVCKLALDDNLNKLEMMKIPYKILDTEKAEYRCCIYRERVIVYEKSQLAACFKPDDNLTNDLHSVEDEEQIVYVLSSACDKCPINRFTVTEACRGCVQHKCMEVCSFKAIARINGKSYIDQNKCKECGLCKKVCPYNAIVEVMRPCKKVCPTGALEINPENRRAMIEDVKCINCGSCVAACPFGAISDKSYIVKVINLLKQKRKVYAVVAPAITGQFGIKANVGQMKTAFRKAGFIDMVEAACGADAVAVNETSEFIERMKNGEKYMTTSCCPSFVKYIENEYKDVASNVSNTVSPMIATGRMIKNMDKDACVVFVGPCIAKKSEIKRPELKDAVDYVITFEEIAALFGALNIEVGTCDEVDVDDASSFGRGFAESGGVTAAVENYVKSKNVDIEFNPLKVSGREQIKKTIMLAKMGKLPHNFIEGMMCDGGCIGGPAANTSIIKAKGPLAKFSKESKEKSVIDNKKLSSFKNINMNNK
ncbi:4Fe-4S dicluster domain-containing protein [Clostridium niameyense]|uniref:4Fe-4S dicluster domain-containing protein n=1 Tax=Clostridium niameyense TaxID=1622073 RepID=A0A6M0R9B4_9CLOT|nr:4Fe-4S dicluster domain-containing protein [Clostridium niameyense]NEZ46796.1 4Fe-4S dicluster domain-containing protein [Clostridium niameyense]